MKRAQSIKLNYFDRGCEKQESGDYVGAIEDFSEAIRRNYENIERAYGERGSCYHSLKKYDKAIEDINYAIRHTDEDDREEMYSLYATRAHAYVGKTQLRQSIQDFEKAISFCDNEATRFVLRHFQKTSEDALTKPQAASSSSSASSSRAAPPPRPAVVTQPSASARPSVTSAASFSGASSSSAPAVNRSEIEDLKEQMRRNLGI